ncbi:MAG: hypothetical protein ACI89L_001481 [Phycisphaerales bacterium]|jgi:hypothetical protein
MTWRKATGILAVFFAVVQTLTVFQLVTNSSRVHTASNKLFNITQSDLRLQDTLTQSELDTLEDSIKHHYESEVSRGNRSQFLTHASLAAAFGVGGATILLFPSRVRKDRPPN